MSSNSTWNDWRSIARLRRAIESGAITVAYQPQIRLKDNALVGFEALARWNDPELGPIGPDTFIPLADKTGQIGPLTRLVLRSALAEAKAWPAQVTLSVNLSVRSLLDIQLAEDIATMMTDARAPAGQLVIELTEDSLMSLSHDALEPLRRLRDKRIRLSIDDFGTGYSSLAYLRSLPVQELKIDKSFMADVTELPGPAALVASIIDVAHVLGLTVVAEGVEDGKTIEFLRDAGCDLAQGYFIGRPLAPDQIAEWIESWTAAHGADHPAARERGSWSTTEA